MMSGLETSYLPSATIGPKRPTGQVLEFLTVTSLPHRGVDDEEARRIVRSHAIRDANRRKRLKADPEAKQISGAAPPKLPAQSTLTTKFKLNKKPVKDKKEAFLPRNKEWECFLATNTLMRSSRSSLTLALGMGEIDPFDSLAIKLGPTQQAMLDYQKSQLEQSAFCIGSKEVLFNFAARDTAWLNSILCLISLHRDLQVGKGISRECLMHRAEALRIVNQRLTESPRHVSEETIGAIAALANFETSNGYFQGATMHLNGLLNILANRGPSLEGLLPLENVFLQKVVAWVDLSYCTTWDLSPQLPLLATGLCRASIQEYAYFLLSLYPPDTDMLSPHDLVGEMAVIFQVLRLLSLRIHSLPKDVYTRMAYDRGLYMSEYKLLIVLDSPDGVDDGMAMPSRNSHIYGSCRLAAYLYLYLVLRELPASAVIVQTVLKRLKSILEKANADLLTMWREDQHLFLWILYMGAVASIAPQEREFFVQVLRRVTMQMGLHTMEAFTGALKEVLWEPGFCQERAVTRCLWAELQRQ